MKRWVMQTERTPNHVLLSLDRNPMNQRPKGGSDTKCAILGDTRMRATIQNVLAVNSNSILSPHSVRKPKTSISTTICSFTQAIVPHFSPVACQANYSTHVQNKAAEHPTQRPGLIRFAQLHLYESARQKPQTSQPWLPSNTKNTS